MFGNSSVISLSNQVYKYKPWHVTWLSPLPDDKLCEMLCYCQVIALVVFLFPSVDVLQVIPRWRSITIITRSRLLTWRLSLRLSTVASTSWDRWLRTFACTAQRKIPWSGRWDRSSQLNPPWSMRWDSPSRRWHLMRLSRHRHHLFVCLCAQLHF